MPATETRSAAPVTALLTVAVAGAYALELAAGGDAVCDTYGFSPAHATVGTALSSLFVHDPSSFAHVGGNLAFLVILGVVVEREIGSLLFTVLFAAAGLGGAALHSFVEPTTLVGCSGALFGLLAVLGVLQPRMLGFVVAFVGLNIWHAFFGGGGSASFACHIGGFVVGAVFAVCIRFSRNVAVEA